MTLRFLMNPNDRYQNGGIIRTRMRLRVTPGEKRQKKKKLRQIL